MGCHLTRTKAKNPDRPHHRRQGGRHFLDEYGQPITVQGDKIRRRSHRRPQSNCAMECSSATDRQWDDLRPLGLIEGQGGKEEDYSPSHYYSHLTVSPDLYSANVIMSPDIYPPNSCLPRPSQHPGSNYLPSVSYSLDHLDRLDYQAAGMLTYQPTSENCLIGCYNTEGVEPEGFPRQLDYRPLWRSDRPLGYLPLSELDSGLSYGPNSPHHQVLLSEAETDAMSSLPGHTPSSQGSSSSSESLISSEPSDSGFHSISTGDHRRLHKIHGNHAHQHAHHLRSGHSPREQRGCWDLESIPETTPVSHACAPQRSHCTVGNSTTTTVHFHRAERSPTLPRHHSPPSPAISCRTEPCQRRALWLEQQQEGRGTLEMPGRSQTITDLSEGRCRRRASHPNMTKPPSLTNRFWNQSGTSSSTLGLRSRASCPSNCHPPSPSSTDRTSHQNLSQSKEDSLIKSPASVSSGASDWRGFQTLGNCTRNPKGSSVPFYSTLAAPPHSPCSPPSPRSRLSNQKSVRNQLLRARAYRLARERSEVTTDEEVRGEGARESQEEGEQGQWMGRYWSRTERRRHLALSRQHRERRGGETGGGQGALLSQTVLELSHMKQNQLRNSKLLDDWTTVEELLTHGTRVESDSQLCPSPLLSVTTV